MTETIKSKTGGPKPPPPPDTKADRIIFIISCVIVEMFFQAILVQLLSYSIFVFCSLVINKTISWIGLVMIFSIIDVQTRSSRSFSIYATFLIMTSITALLISVL